MANTIDRTPERRAGATLPPAVLGIADHCGWAEFVCVAEAAGAPAVVARRRVELLDDGLPNLPHEHEAQGLAPDEAAVLVDRVRRSARERSRVELDRLRTELEGAARLVAVALRAPPATAIPAAVADVLASRAATCAADGELFRSALAAAAAAAGLRVVVHPRNAKVSDATPALGRDADAFLKEVGRELGPPWRKEHRVAAAAAIAALLGGDDRP